MEPQTLLAMDGVRVFGGVAVGECRKEGLIKEDSCPRRGDALRVRPVVSDITG